MYSCLIMYNTEVVWSHNVVMYQRPIYSIFRCCVHPNLPDEDSHTGGSVKERNEKKWECHSVQQCFFMC